MDQLVACLADDSISKLWRAKGASTPAGILTSTDTSSLASSYFSSRSDTPFISYFASTTPDSDSKRTRLKTVLFIQGSTLFDPKAVRSRLTEHAKILKLELAILEGKVSFISCGSARAVLTFITAWKPPLCAFYFGP